MESPLISVIIPVYNVGKYISECLESVLNQTYKSIEMIVIDDGSTDQSLDIVKSFAEKYSNIKVLTQCNSGQSVARNKGIECARGKYIYFLDSDDYILENTFETLIGVMEQKNLDFIHFGARPFIDGIDIDLNENLYDVQKSFESRKVYDRQSLLQDIIKAFRASPCLYIVKKEILINHNLRFTPNLLHEDELFTIEVILNVTSSMYDPKLYYQRRYRENSVMTSTSVDKLKKSFNSYCVIIEQLNILKEKYKDRLELNLINSRIHSIYIGLIHKDLDKSYKKNQFSKMTAINKKVQLFYQIKYKLKKQVKHLLGYSV
ncbi:glycosyltransferase [Actinomycetes bacterium NPDC127524]